MEFKPNQLTNIEVSVIVVNYNTFELTCSCLSSIFSKTSNTKIEVILVDNNSKECSPDLFKVRFPEIKLIKNDRNLGFGAANNIGMKDAKGKYFLLLNSDAYLLNNAIDEAFKFAEKYKDCAEIFGANVLNPDLSIQRSFFTKKDTGYLKTFKTSFLDSNPVLYKLNLKRQNFSSKEVGGLYGSYIFLNRKVFEQTGGFDPDFFMYCEDTEWFRNRINKKFNTLICENAQLVHLGGGSSKATKASAMNILSYYLYWYKLGYLHYLIFVLGTYLNLPITLLLSIIMTKRERKRHLSIVKCRIKVLPKVFFDIPRFKNGFGSRKFPLGYNG